MALNNIIPPSKQITTAAGKPLAGGKVFLFEPGTTTFVNAYQDSGLVTPHSNPVKLSGSGRANIWITRDVDMFITDRNSGDLIPTNIILSELNANPDALGADEAGGLIPNGSFELDADADTIPDGWTLLSEAGSTNAIDTSDSTDGAQSFRFTSSGAGGGSLTTSDFFPVNDVDPLRVNVDLRSSVAGVHNIVRVEWYDVSQVAISNSDPYDSTSNPLTWTSQNLVALPPAGARFAKLKLIGCDPDTAVAGSTWFDRASVFYPAVVTGVFDNITIQNNEIITTNTNGDMDLSPNGTGSVNITTRSIIGDPGTENSGITVAGATYESVLKVSDLGSSNAAQFILHRHSNTLAPLIVTARSHSSDATHAAVQDGDYLFQLYGTGWDGSNYEIGASISMEVNGTPGANDMPTDIVFATSPDGSATPVERFRISESETSLRGSLNNDPAASGNQDALLKFLNSGGLEAAAAGFAAGNTNLYLTNRTHGGVILLNSEDSAGVSRNLFIGDPDSTANLYHAGATSLATSATGVNLFGSSTADPATGGNQDTQIGFYNQSAALAGQLGFKDSNANLSIANRTHGGNVILSAEDTGGSLQNLYNADPDGGAFMYYAGSLRASLVSDGIGIWKYDSLDTGNNLLRLYHANGTLRGYLGHISDVLYFVNEIDGGNVNIRGSDTGGTLRTMFTGNPDGAVGLNYNGANVSATLPAASGGFQVNNTLTGAGLERVLTESDAGDLVPTRVVKSSSTIRASTTTQSADPELTVSITTAALYKVDLWILTQAASATPNIKLGLDWSGAVNDNRGYLAWGTDDTGVENIFDGQFSSTPAALTFQSKFSTIDANLIRISGMFDANGAGTLALHWSQNTSDANATTVLRHSVMEITQLT